jgi:DNA-binding transcriptional regulator YhcF (GntR family)
VVLFADDPGMDQLDAFMQRLAGLVKHALRTEDGLVSVQRLAAATAQRTGAVQPGLRWLASRGHVRIQAEEGDAIRLAAGDGASNPEWHVVTAQLREQLAETTAFRRYFSQADADALLD